MLSAGSGVGLPTLFRICLAIPPILGGMDRNCHFPARSLHSAPSSLGPTLVDSGPCNNLEPFPHYAKLLAVLPSSLGNTGYSSVEPAFPARGFVTWTCR